jgi:hypothetical protein
MKKIVFILGGFTLISLFFQGCNQQTDKTANLSPQDSLMQAKINELAVVKLTTDLAKLSEKEKQMIPLLIDAAKIMDDLFWKQTLGDKEKFISGINDSLTLRFVEINYGPWEK